MVMWAKVSEPPLELIEILCDTAKELADRCGVTKGTVYANADRYAKRKFKYSRYIRIEIDDKEITGISMNKHEKGEVKNEAND